MKYNLYINQKAVYKEFKNELNIIDCVVLDVISNMFLNHKKLQNTYYDNDFYIWCKPTLVLIQCPLLNIGEKQVKNIIVKLCNLGVLKRHPKNESLRKMYITLGDKFELITNSNQDKNIDNLSVKKFTDKNSYTDNSINKKEDYNIIDFKNNSCEIEISQEKELNIISKQNDFVNQYPEVIDLLDVSMIEVFKENKYTIDEFCKSKDFELIKKEYRMVKRNLPVPKPKNRETLINWYLTLGKVQVADNLYMYPYEAILLKLVFNHKYLSKMINHYDTTYFARDNKFKEYTDHYANIVSWLKSDIEKNILKQGNNQFDRYYYYNWGVDRNEIL